ncbi:MAG: hypothetical protein HY718_08360, partial [Planctomycetes bacterium]|nr:hypothetical protein [Planctomycetota bacterium]
MNKHHSSLLIAVASVCLVSVSVTDAAPDAGEMARIIGRGDINRGAPPRVGERWLPLYQGNGRLGCCFGPWGLHAVPGQAHDYVPIGVTQFTHLKHYVRAKFNADYLLPLASIHWETEPASVRQYQQHQVFYDGTVLTRFQTDQYGVEVLSWIDPVDRDVAGLRIDARGDCPPIVVGVP